MEDKIRLEIKTARKGFVRETIKDTAVCKNTEKLLNELDFDTLLTYSAMNGEPDLTGVTTKYLQAKNIAYPVCVDNFSLDFKQIKDLSQLSKGKYGILEPVTDDVVTDFEKAVCLVPGVAFGNGGQRIGNGAGYYDRFLYGKDIIKIGICYNEFLFKTLAQKEHDIAMDYIVTEEGIKKLPQR